MVSLREFKFKEWEFLIIFLITFFALFIRFFGGLSLFQPDGFYLPTDDPPYHLRRIFMLIRGEASYHDPFVSFPRNPIVCWHWGFDALIFILIYPFVNENIDPQKIMIISSLIIPFLGAIQIPLIYFLGKKIFSIQTAIIASIIISFLPSHVDYSFFGRVDHHVLEPLFAISIAGLLLQKQKTILSILAGFLTGISLSFYQSAFPLLLFSSFIANILFLFRNHSFTPSFLPYNIALILSTFISVIASPFSSEIVFFSPSLLHLMLCLYIFFSSLLFFIIKKIWKSKSIIFIGINLLSLSVLFLFFPSFFYSLIDGFSYLGGKGIGSLSFESSSIIDDPKRFFMLTSYLLPLCFFPLIKKDFRRNIDKLIIFLFFLFSLILAMFQRRFLMFSSPFISIFIAEGILIFYHFFSQIFSIRKFAFVFIIFSLSILALYPSIRHILNFTPLGDTDIAMVKTARFISKIKNKDPLKSAVLLPWAYGHVFQFEAEVPTLCDNFFGPPAHNAGLIDCLKAFYSMDKIKTLKELTQKGVRYIALIPPHPEQVRREAKILGFEPSFFVNEKGYWTKNFFQTLYVYLALSSGAIKISNPPKKIPGIKTIHIEGSVILLEIQKEKLLKN